MLKGCSLRAQVSWIIPAQISIALTISAHSLSPSLASPLPHRVTGMLPSYWFDPPISKCRPPSSGPGVRAVAKPVGNGRDDAPHWAQLGFEKVKHFSSTKFQPGQQRGDSVLRPPPRSPDQKVSPITGVLLNHFALSLPFSKSEGGGGGSDISLTSNTAVNSFCAAVLDSGVTLESHFWERHTAGVKGESARAGSVLSLNVTNAYRHRIEQFSNYINPSAGCHISSATRSLLRLIRFRPIEKSVVTLPPVSCHNSHQRTMHLSMYNR